ncbi:MAG: hypothetical protein R3F11_09240 [Verrucomicrobiales bacterium]
MKFRIASEAVMNGLIGKVKHVEVGLPTGKGHDSDDGKSPSRFRMSSTMTCGAVPAACCRFRPTGCTGTGAGASTTAAVSSWTGSKPPQ